MMKAVRHSTANVPQAQKLITAMSRDDLFAFGADAPATCRHAFAAARALALRASKHTALGFEIELLLREESVAVVTATEAA
jgi:hypothetical protein